MSSEKKYINSDFQSFFENNLSSSDPEIYKAINDELLRQQQHIELIASENIVSNASVSYTHLTLPTSSWV